MIGLALSGGGSRAIAFHLGCLRALHDRQVLKNVSVISSVSGGSVIAALYAYSDHNFSDFDERVLRLLRTGLNRAILKELISPDLFLKILATNLIARPAAIIAELLKREPPFRRWASRTHALERALENILGQRNLSAVGRPNLDVVFNASEMRTGTAFRFSNRRSGAWRFGEIDHARVSIAHAVAASAAYPMFLPGFDEQYMFKRGEREQRKRVVITDGGVYDNLGTSCLEPDRNLDFTLHAYPCDYIICCYAGHGQFRGNEVPFGFRTRAQSAFESVFRKVQDAALNRLHALEESGKIRGFILPYLGQQDDVLPCPPPDLVRRDEVFGYPTNFSAMPEEMIKKLTLRGEQLTRLLLTRYCPEV